MQVREAISAAATRLKRVSDSPRLDAELLMAYALGVGRDELLLRQLDADVAPGFEALVERRETSEPVAYITGTRDFWTISLRVTPDVLIPRPDTETLLEAATFALLTDSAPRILDLGTGSGALLLAALKEWPRGFGVGVDRSEAAVRVARDNARALGLHARAMFVVGDWGAAIAGGYDAIFCNPPYIGNAEPLPQDVAAYEPATALYAGADGMDEYRKLIPQLPGLLASGGVAFIEIGATQANAVQALGHEHGLAVEVRRDLAERDRCVILRRT